MTAEFASFVALSAILSVTPGPDTMLVLSNSIAGGSKNGIATTLGVKAGTLSHSLLAALGVAAFLLQFSEFYAVMKTVGATYLVALGLFIAFKAMRADSSVKVQSAEREKSWWRCFSEGYASNITNPKVVVFYVAVLPQFIAPSDNVLIATAKLASVHVGISFAWLCFVSLFVGKVRDWILVPRVRRTINACSGAAIAAFGIKLALSTK